MTFVLVSAVLIMTPGPDTAITTRNALRGGWRAASLTAGGVATGQLVWAAATGAGLVAVLAASAIAFTVVKFAGAAYLTILGVRTLRGMFRPADPLPAERGGQGWGPEFTQGLVNNLLNPKCAAIFLSVFPQFVHPGAPLSRLLLMGGLFALMTFTWLNILGALLARAGRRFGGRLKRAADALAGTVMIGLGLRVAVSR